MSRSRLCFANIKQQSILLKWNQIYNWINYILSPRYYVPFKKRNLWAATFSGSSLSKRIFARCLYAWKSNSFLTYVASRPIYFLSFAASVLAPFWYEESCIHSSLLVFSLSIPHSRYRWVSLKRKLSSSGVGALHTHSYIYMFLDIYNCRVCLGIKSGFRCEVLKYEKLCAEKYPH